MCIRDRYMGKSPRAKSPDSGSSNGSSFVRSREGSSNFQSQNNVEREKREKEREEYEKKKRMSDWDLEVHEMFEVDEDYSGEPLKGRDDLVLSDDSMAHHIPPEGVGKVPVTIRHFEAIGKLGAGAFAKVFKVKKVDDKKVFALKVLQKSEMYLRNSVQYAVTEANVFRITDHPFIIKLHYAFEGVKHVYFALDYCPGGDLYSQLQKRGNFTEQESKFYFCEMLLAIEYLHEKDIIYRDIKPENILLDSEGHVKLSDFGLAKEKMSNTCYSKTFCGSPAYVSPDLLNGIGYGKETDVYGLGVLLFELIMGEPPFFANNFKDLFENVKKGDLKFPKEISSAGKDLISKLLCRDPKQRLGSKSKQDIKRHAFFEGVNWNDVYTKRLKPPIVEMVNVEEERKDNEEHMAGFSYDYSTLKEFAKKI
eukprot:TRINITY_DN416_c0_g1_i8.p1 TRINITY_DN416_c0_g1~~TRINITY_DN416_c0_g1_i8.p1  ORF type:complete len:422 (-),score=111.02 TRINITY_DN416_c0_g1_i8:266-1531(-)